MTPPPRSSNGDKVIKTDPDPTAAVKEAMTLAIQNLRIEFRSDIGTLKTEINGMRTATALARQELNDKLSATMETIKGMFAANKDLVDQLAKANQTALTAALLTQEKAAMETKTSMLDSLRQLQATFMNANLATNEKIDRLTSRLDTGDGRMGANSVIRAEGRQDSDTSRTHNLGLIMMVISIASVGVAVAIALVPHLGK